MRKTKALKINRQSISNILLTIVFALSISVFQAPVKVSAGTIGAGWVSPLTTMPTVSAGFLTGCGNGSYLDGKYHIGNDYPIAAGTRVNAIGDGTVRDNLSFGSGWARVLFVQHKSSDGSDFVVLYGHINPAAGMSKGAKVSAGQQIATVADLTKAGDHLHLGLVPATTYPSSGWGMQPCKNYPYTNGFTDPIAYLASHPYSGSGTSSGGSGPTSVGNMTIGVYNPGIATFDLRNTNTPGNHNVTLQYGNIGAIPIVGDWDGNGTDTIGVYNPSIGTFDLRNSNTPGNHDITFQYGNVGVGAIPVVGNWDGIGGDSVGLYYPSTGVFDLRNSLTAGNHDYRVQYGNIGAIPIIGDWDGNGTDTIGVYNPNIATFDLRNSNTPGNHDITLQYGNIGAKPIVGDWDGIGGDSIGVYNPNIATFDLRNSNTPGNHDITLQYGNIGAKPIVGDWDGITQ